MTTPEPKTFKATVIRRRGRSTKTETLTLELLESATDSARFSAYLRGGLPYGLVLIRRGPYWVLEISQAQHTSTGVLKLLTDFNGTDICLVLSGANGEGER